LVGWDFVSFPGSNHREMPFMARAAMPPHHVIVAATRNAADAAGRLANRSTVEPASGPRSRRGTTPCRTSATSATHASAASDDADDEDDHRGPKMLKVIIMLRVSTLAIGNRGMSIFDRTTSRERLPHQHLLE
jgi:hypothetical protein